MIMKVSDCIGLIIIINTSSCIYNVSAAAYIIDVNQMMANNNKKRSVSVGLGAIRVATVVTCIISTLI